VTAFRWYLGGMTCWFVAYGVQLILFSWLVAVVLRQPPDRVGIAQMTLMAPSILFMLLGGAVADRSDCRVLLVRYQLLAIVPPLGLATLIASGGLGYGGLLAFGVAMGTLSAFVIPARDALLTRVATGELPRAIAMATAAQYVAQIAGIAIAGSAHRVGAVALLVLQGLLMAVGALTIMRLDPAPPRGVVSGQGRRAAMRDGWREAMGSPRIRPLIIAMAAVGVLFVGAFTVILPVLVRDAYGGSSAELATANACFWGGTILATAVQVRLGALRRSGRAIMVTLAGGALILAAMAIPGPFVALALLCLVWGMGAGVVITQGRTIVQMAAPESHRARILALFQLGIMGGAPVGAFAMGFVARAVGARASVVYPAAAMLLVLVYLLLRSDLWQDEQSVAVEGAATA
jgi:MFS family permease